MRKKKIKLENIDSDILEIRLEDILNLITESEITWSIQFIHATTKVTFNNSILDFEREVQNSVNGVFFDTKELIGFAKQLNQIIEIFVIGDDKKENLKKYDSDIEAYNNCSYVLELQDSSYWIINANNNFIEQLFLEFPGGVSFESI